MSQSMSPPPVPVEIALLNQSRALELSYADGSSYRLPYEFLRVYSPSAEVRGHGPGQEVLQTGKRDVLIVELEPVGHYAVKPTFSDGHDSGLFSWAYLHELCVNQQAMWDDYLARMQAAGASRDPAVIPASASVTVNASGEVTDFQVVSLARQSGGGCSSGHH